MSFILAAVTLAAGYAQPESHLPPLPRKPFMNAQFTEDPSGGIAIGQVGATGTIVSSGIKTGDIILKVNGKSTPTFVTFGEAMNVLTPSDSVKAVIKREGKEEEITLKVVERPRDPGDEDTEVIYDQVVSQGERMRTIITRPRKPGKYPVLFFVQGITYSSVEAPIAGTNYLSTFLKAFAKDYVTLRVEKPGCGDSEGAANENLSFWREGDVYVQALRAVKQYDFVDPKKVYIFGHSMGGIYGPITAAREPVAGVAVYGTFILPWEEYMVRNVHRQSLFSGESEEAAKKNADDQVKFGKLFFQKGLSPDQALKADPTLKEYYDGYMSGGGRLYNGRSFQWNQELAAADMYMLWKSLDCAVLSIHGTADFITFEDEHRDLAKLAKRGTFVELANADHAFYNRATPVESLQNWSKPGNVVNPAVMKTVRDWIDGLN